MTALKGGSTVPRPKKTWGAVQLSPGQASYVIDRLVSERRISAGEINRYVSEMHREIADLEQKLASLRQAIGTGARPGRPAAAPRAAAAPAKRGRKRRAPITPEQLASRKLQGRYLGLIRQIPANKRAPFQKTAKEKGREAAIKDMMAALKK